MAPTQKGHILEKLFRVVRPKAPVITRMTGKMIFESRHFRFRQKARLRSVAGSDEDIGEVNPSSRFCREPRTLRPSPFSGGRPRNGRTGWPYGRIACSFHGTRQSPL